MSRSRQLRPRRPGVRALGAFVAVALIGGLGTGLAQGERIQEGSLIVILNGSISPLKLPRHSNAPVAVHMEGGLETEDGSLLPRVTQIELSLPKQGVLSTYGLPVCPMARIRNTTPKAALRECEPALVGEGDLRADVALPDQAPFSVEASLLAFNGRVDGHRAMILHAFAARPPLVVIVPFILVHSGGRRGNVLVADLSPTLGPWPHFAHFSLTFSRRYSYRGKEHSYLSASCPIPPRFTAGFFSLAKAKFTLLDGEQVNTGIVRGCRGL
jgi:hypothetical protein